MGAGDGFFGLNNLDCVGDARREPVAGLREALFGQIYIAECYGDLVR